MRPALSLLALLALAGCGGDSTMTDAGPADAGPVDTGVPTSCMPSDGTITGDCRLFDCKLRQAAAMYCTGSTTGFFFDCTGVDMLPAAYQATVDAYFLNCPAVWPTLMDTDVPVMGGSVHSTVCQQVNCTHLFDNARGPMYPMVVNAECAPIAMSTACDLPTPP